MLSFFDSNIEICLNFSSLNSILTIEHHPMQVVTVAMIQAGTTFNVIPDSATIAGTFRAFSRKSFVALRERIEEVTNS